MAIVATKNSIQKYRVQSYCATNSSSIASLRYICDRFYKRTFKYLNGFWFL